MGGLVRKFIRSVLRCSMFVFGTGMPNRLLLDVMYVTQAYLSTSVRRTGGLPRQARQPQSRHDFRNQTERPPQGDRRRISHMHSSGNTNPRVGRRYLPDPRRASGLEGHMSIRTFARFSILSAIALAGAGAANADVF